MSNLKHFITKEGEGENLKITILPLTGKDGTIYTVTNGINVARYTAFEKYSQAASLGVMPKQLFESMKKTHEFFNSGKFADALLNNANNMVSVARIADNELNPFFYLCTMFINAKDEDLTIWNEAMAKQKIDNLNEYAADDFFLFANNIAPVCTDDLSEIFRISMENHKRENEKKD